MRFLGITIKILLLGICVAISPLTLGTVSAADLCGGKQFTLQCLQENFDELYATNYPRFFEILHSAEAKARRCRPIARTARFLELGRLHRKNAEFNEYFGEVSEDMVINQTKCFLDALTRVDEPTRREIIERLRAPITGQDEAIRKALQRYRGERRYGQVVELYLRP